MLLWSNQVSQVESGSVRPGQVKSSTGSSTTRYAHGWAMVWGTLAALPRIGLDRLGDSSRAGSLDVRDCCRAVEVEREREYKSEQDQRDRVDEELATMQKGQLCARGEGRGYLLADLLSSAHGERAEATLPEWGDQTPTANTNANTNANAAMGLGATDVAT